MIGSNIFQNLEDGFEVIFMKKLMRFIIPVVLVLLLAMSACHNEKSAIELITGQYFDWATQSEWTFVIDGSQYHTVNIHEIPREDLETSTIISEEVFFTDSDNKCYVEQGQMKNKLTYYLLRCEKLGLYLLVPHKERRKLFDFDPARPLGFCLELLSENEI